MGAAAREYALSDCNYNGNEGLVPKVGFEPDDEGTEQ